MGERIIREGTAMRFLGKMAADVLVRPSAVVLTAALATLLPLVGSAQEISTKIPGIELLQELKKPVAVITPEQHIGILLDRKAYEEGVRSLKLKSPNAFILKGGTGYAEPGGPCGQVREYGSGIKTKTPKEGEATEETMSPFQFFEMNVVHLRNLRLGGSYAIRLSYVDSEPTSVVLWDDSDPPQPVRCVSGVTVSLGVGAGSEATPAVGPGQREKHGALFHFSKGPALAENPRTEERFDSVKTPEGTLWKGDGLGGFLVIVAAFGPQAQFYFQPGVILGPRGSWIRLPDAGLSDFEVKNRFVELGLGGLVAMDTSETPLGAFHFVLQAFDITTRTGK
jgi:hypothetical protein